jgi:uncharacterized protein YeaO (DUF488 family)
MKLKIIFTFFVLCVLKISAFCQLDTFTSCQKLDSLAHVYFQANNLDSAIIVIEYARSKFPVQDEYLTMALSFLYNNNKQDSKLLENWDYGLKKRYFFGINDWQYEQFKNNPEFKRLLQMDRQLADSLNKLAHVEYEVILPGDYSKNKTYPILFVFHGNNWNLENSKSVWNSKILKEKFITAHIQSYIHMSKDRYQWWLNDEKTNSEFKEIYEQLIKEYPVNQSKVIFTAMSMGGSIAIDYAFNQFVPVYGLVLNCPVVPKISDSLIKKFVDENKKIAIITGEYDWELNNQKELINKVDSLKGNSKITINTGLGHEIAKDFSTFLDGYLNWVLE